MKDVGAVIRERDYKITGVALQDGVCVVKRTVKWSFCQKFSEKDIFLFWFAWYLGNLRNVVK